MIKRSVGNFMYLDFVLEDVAASATQSLDSPPDGLEGYYEQFWGQLSKMRRKHRDLWKEVLRPVIRLLAIAREPVSAGWLARMAKLDEDDVRMDALDTWLHFLAVQQRNGRETYRLFHQSFRDFLDRKLGNLALIHRTVAETTLAPAADGWEACEPYGLRHLLPHLVAVAREAEADDASWAQEQLGHVLASDAFAEASLDRVKRPQELLSSIRSAVTVLLEACELKRTWTAVRRYRDVLKQQRQTEQVFASLHARQLEDAWQSTSFYSERPGFQALLQLLVAWHANRAGEDELGQRAAQAALSQVRRLFDQEEQTDLYYSLRHNWRPLFTEMLFRTARAASPSWLEGLSPGKEGLVAQVDKRASARLSQPPEPKEPPISSGSAIDSLLNKLEARLRENHPTTYREAAMLYREELAQELSKTWHDPRWHEHVERSVTLIALDDYPSYRELALVVIALPIAQHPDDTGAMAGLEVLLKAALEASEPHFTQDLPIALLQVRPDRWEDLQHGLKLAHRLTYTTTWHMAEEPAPYTGHAWGGTFRSDPWAREILRCSAVAAVQHRLGWYEQSHRTLQAAGELDYRPKYAGYRALAHLALACRWVELDDRRAARRETDEAYRHAGLMQEKALGRQRQALARQIRRWIEDEAPILSSDQAWQQLDQLGELEQGWYIRLLSARWMGKARRLRELVPFALDNPTVLDAVLGRLVGTLASVGACLPALESLCKELEMGQEG